MANALVLVSPPPLGATVEPVVVAVLPDELPVATNSHPSRTIPFLVDTVTVLMAANAAETTPEPAWALVVVVPPPQLPVATNPPPVTLDIAVQVTAAVLVGTNAAETTPPPLGATVEPVVVVVAPVQMPVAA